MNEFFRCSKCKQKKIRGEFHEFSIKGRVKPVTSRCKQCRRNDYYQHRYSTFCICCTNPRALDSNNQCKLCNRESGLRECKKCENVLPLYLMFYGNNKVCKECQKSTVKQ